MAEGRLGQRALARAAHAPEQRMVVGQADREPLEVLKEPVPLALHADQGGQGQGIVRRRVEGAAGRVVPEQACVGEVRRGRRRRGQALQRLGDAVQNRFELMRHRCDT